MFSRLPSDISTIYREAWAEFITNFVSKLHAPLPYTGKSKLFLIVSALSFSLTFYIAPSVSISLSVSISFSICINLSHIHSLSFSYTRKELICTNLEIIELFLLAVILPQLEGKCKKAISVMRYKYIIRYLFLIYICVLYTYFHV